MAAVDDEQIILESLRRIPSERWGDVLHFLDALGEREDAPAIRTGSDLIASGLVGAWADRDDLGTTEGFARSLRTQAENRPGSADAAGH